MYVLSREFKIADDKGYVDISGTECGSTSWHRNLGSNFSFAAK